MGRDVLARLQLRITVLRGAGRTPGATEDILIDQYLNNANTLTRLRSGPVGPFIDDFASFMGNKGYRRRTGQSHLRAIGHLSRWLEDSGRVLPDLDEGAIDALAADLRSSTPAPGLYRGGLADLRRGTHLFLAWLRANGVVRTSSTLAAAVPPNVAAFESWMIRHRGLTTNTVVSCYRPILVRFLGSVGDQPSSYTASSIRAFILEQASHYSRSHTTVIMSAVRMFLRHLATTGACLPAIIAAVPTVAHWKKTTLPRGLDREDVERIVAACDPAATDGCRDRAIVLLVARLGLRAGDVAGLHLGDIDWAGGRLWVCGKSRRRAALPLPQDVGDALLGYLAHGRAQVADDHVFVGLLAPHRSVSRPVIGAVVARAAERAGVGPKRVGSHILRHSLATNLLADGMSLGGIAAVLRHASVETTTIYAKVDIALLGMVARSWPLEVAP